MATYNQVSYGSKGSSVTELQKLLNNNGYGLTVDGIYGAKTQAAVKDYQQKNGLAVDGIVGSNTWGALTAANTTQPAPSTGTSTPTTTTPATSTTAPTTTTTPATTAPNAATTPTTAAQDTSFKYDDYKPSDAVAQAEALLNQQLSQKPGEYQSTWQDQLNEILQQILNREKFSYDLNGDSLYQQYKDQYTTKGNMAMMDTMGQAQAMTGGYGNSYAQSVGQQAYQGYLQELNDKIPELYQLAMNKYQMEEDAMYNQAALMAQQEEMDYGRYRDQLGDWQSERDFLTSRYDTERDYDYSKWVDGRDFAYGQYADDRSYNYQTGRDKVADQQWQAEFDEAQRQFNEQMALKTGSSSSGSGGSGNGSGNGSGTTGNQGYSKDLVKMAQNYVGAGVDGSWGSESAAKAKAKGYGSLADVLNAMGYTSKGALEGNTGNEPYNPTPATQANLKSVTKDLNNVIDSMLKSNSTRGVIESECNALINSARAAGIITTAEANSLKNTFIPSKLAY